MTPSKTFYATLLGGILLTAGIPQVYASSVDYNDTYSTAKYKHSTWEHKEIGWEHRKFDKASDHCDKCSDDKDQPDKLPLFTLDTDYDQVEYFNGSYSSIMGFTVVTGGTYELTLTDLSFPDPLKDLGAAVSTSKDKLGQVFGSGSFLFDAEPGISYYLSVFADTKYCDLGMFGLNLHTYSGTPSAVPVPGALWLFGSGLLGVAGFVRRKS